MGRRTLLYIVKNSRVQMLKNNYGKYNKKNYWGTLSSPSTSTQMKGHTIVEIVYRQNVRHFRA